MKHRIEFALGFSSLAGNANSFCCITRRTFVTVPQITATAPKTTVSTATTSIPTILKTRSSRSVTSETGESTAMKPLSSLTSSYPPNPSTKEQIDHEEIPFTACSKLGLNPLQNRFHAPIIYHPNYSFDNWPSHYTFPMDKFKRLAHAVTTTCSKTHPQSSQLSRPLVRSFHDFFVPLHYNHPSSTSTIPNRAITQEMIQTWFAEPKGPLCPKFLSSFLSGDLSLEECRMIGFREQTSKPELIERTVLEVLGTILTCQLAYQYGIASNLAGGTHHASRSAGAGYTILNDLAIAANFLTDMELNEGSISTVNRVLVIDTDVHQGDGTAKFGNLGKLHRLATLSIHCSENYPRRKADSDYDIGLPSGTSDDEYMKRLQESVELAFEEVRPDFVLYDAGIDVFVDDTLGRLHLSENGIRKRDRYVLNRCVELGIPVAAVIGGGYDKDIDALARRHAIVHEECAYVWRKHKLWIQ